MGTDIHGVVQYTSNYGSSGWADSPGPVLDGTRNYSLFSALADVRNDGSIVPIFSPRGLPEGFITDNDNNHGNIWMGYHGFTWFTFKELDEWEGWLQTFSDKGVITKESYDKWDRKCPPMWSKSIGGSGIIVADETTNSFPNGWTHIRVEWQDSLIERCATFLAWFEYAKLAVWQNDLEKIRLVIGFDS